MILITSTAKTCTYVYSYCTECSEILVKFKGLDNFLEIMNVTANSIGAQRRATVIRPLHLPIPRLHFYRYSTPPFSV